MKLFMDRYKLCKKYKWFDWIDDNIFWYIYDKPKDWYKTVRCWFYIDALNPYTWKLVWYNIFHNRPWDMCYTYELLSLQINKSLYYFQNRATFLSSLHRESIIKWQKIALSLLDILNNEYKLYDMVPEDENADAWDKHTYKCLINVNTKNAERFAERGVDYEHPTKTIKCWEYMLNQPHELYIVKARHLLYRILNEYSGEWWD